MSAGTASHALPLQTAPARLIEVRIAKPWRLSRRASRAARRPASLKGCALAAIVSLATLPTARQDLWFDPDLSVVGPGSAEEQSSELRTLPPGATATSRQQAMQARATA